MVKDAIQRLEHLLEIIPPLLFQIPEEAFSEKPVPNKWSKKEIIGHLIDSATNNHHRLVRGQFEDLPKISYKQNNWNESNFYQKMEGHQLISFWLQYNKHLLSLMRHMPEGKFGNKVLTGEGGENEVMNLAFVFEDYVRHLEHHLRQVVSY